MGPAHLAELQPAAYATLVAAAGRPVHAYLFAGPAGSGKRAFASWFATSLLCPNGGCGHCGTCERALAGVHPDVSTIEPEGTAISIGMAREVSRQAAMSPAEASHKVIVLPGFHLVAEAGPALLKTIEEPPATTVFVVLADYVPPALVTIASRCVTVPFLAVSTEKLAAVLEAEGASAEAALSAASSSGGNLGRARLLLSDPSCAARRRLWQSVPSRLDGSGLAAARTAEELLSSVSASMEVLVAAQKAEVAAALEERDRFGAVRGKGKKPRKAPAGVPKELEERHKRAQKAHRSEELKAGLSALAEVYRDRAATGREVEACARAVEQIDRFVSDLRFNPVELLQLQALLLRLS